MSMAGLIFNLTEILPGCAAVDTWGSAFCGLPVAQMTGWDTICLHTEPSVLSLLQLYWVPGHAAMGAYTAGVHGC